MVDLGYTRNGRDFYFYKDFSVTQTSFGQGTSDGYQSNNVITFPTQHVTFTISSASVVEISFNGQTVHAKLDGTASGPTKILSCPGLTVSKFWFRVVSGTNPALVGVQAW